MKLELKHISPYLPYGLKGNLENLEFYDTVINKELYRVETGKTEASNISDVYVIVGSTEAEVQDFKPILRPLSDLTKEIEHNGEKFVPLIKLFKLSRGSYEINIKHYSIMSSEWIKIEMLGHRDYHLRIISIESDVRLDKGYSFECFSTDLRCDDKKIEFVQNHNLLFQKLYEWHFDVFGLIEQGLAININTLNQEK